MLEPTIYLSILLAVVGASTWTWGVLPVAAVVSCVGAAMSVVAACGEAGRRRRSAVATRSAGDSPVRDRPAT